MIWIFVLTVVIVTVGPLLIAAGEQRAAKDLMPPPGRGRGRR